MKRIPVIMYHALESEKHPANSRDEGEHIYVVGTAKFEEHIKYLRDSNITPLALDAFLSGKDIPERSVLITFDDGHVSNLTLALEILEKYNTSAVFFITTGWINKANFMTPEQIRELHKRGMSVGTHGVTHRLFDDLSENEVRSELTESKTVLEEIINEKVTAFSAPGGRLHPCTTSLSKEIGYEALFTSGIGLYDSSKDLFDIPRIDIKRDIDMSDFINIVEGDNHYLRKLSSKAKHLGHIKKLLGNALYTKLRSIALKLR